VFIATLHWVTVQNCSKNLITVQVFLIREFQRTQARMVRIIGL